MRDARVIYDSERCSVVNVVATSVSFRYHEPLLLCGFYRRLLLRLLRIFHSYHFYCSYLPLGDDFGFVLLLPLHRRLCCSVVNVVTVEIPFCVCYPFERKVVVATKRVFRGPFEVRSVVPLC